MNEKIKRIFLLPSIILANAYLLAGTPVDFKNNSNQSLYTTKIKTETNEFSQEVKSVSVFSENSDNLVIPDLAFIFSILALSIGLPLLTKKKNDFFKIQLKKLEFFMAILEEIQIKIFANIKSFRTTFHSLFFKFYTNSLPI